METDKLLITDAGIILNDDLTRIDDYLREFELSPKDELHIRLLMEETLGMVKAMTGDYKALLWLEKEGNICKVKMTAKTEMDVDKKKELLSVSKSGENALAKGFMGKIGEIIENGILNYENIMKLQQTYGGGYVDYAALGGNPSDSIFEWRLDQYREALDDVRSDDDAAGSAWDELEKSIVANLAKDVIVGVKKSEVELTIVAELAGV